MYRKITYAVLALLFACAHSMADVTHRVRKGETLTEIAAEYKVSVKAIKNANSIRNANKIKVGQELTIPTDAAPAPVQRTVKYVIRKGDNLSDIAAQYGITAKQLASYNNIKDANKIRVGQIIQIPVGGRSTASSSKDPVLDSSVARQLANIRAKRNQWKHIVIHHSGSRVDSAKKMDRYHREERNMENGLAYHFVIGNGTDMGDGEIYIGERWKKQIQGGHLSSYALNQISIGICLVGNFQETKPTRKQMEQLEALVRYLMNQTHVPPERVTTHTLIHPKHTLCPGRYFPSESFKRKIAN